MTSTVAMARGQERDDGETLERLREASALGQAESVENRLRDVQTWLGEEMQHIERILTAIDDVAVDPDTLAQRAAGHLLAQAGKRIRPMCVLLAAKFNNKAAAEHVRSVAVAGELVHAATLLHDDVIDEGTMRRSAPAARMVYGNSASVLGGDHLLVRALRLVQSTGDMQIVASLLSTLDEMIEAEAVQLSARQSPNFDRATAMRIIRGKTGALFRWSFAAGGQLAALDAALIDALGEIGMALGIAFQLIDDVIDFTSPEHTLGKKPFADLREGKMTWPVLLAAEKDPSIRRLLIEASGDADDALRDRLVSAVREQGGLEQARRDAEAQVASARAALRLLPEGAPRQTIESVAAALLHRIA